MSDTPAVLVLVANADRREVVRRRLLGLEVRPIAVHAERAADAVERYQPISALIDDTNATAASDDFLETACTHHVRLVSLSESDRHGVAIDAALQNAVRPRPAA
jgi:hypothetical protein